MSKKLKQRIETIRNLARGIGRNIKLMEVCGTHTMAAFRSGLRTLLPASVELLSGPGCPVCVTPTSYIDHAVEIAKTEKTVIATFGDMLRVPGTMSSLETVKAQGGDIRVVYSPDDALDMAIRDEHKRIVFLGIGFETTAPVVAWSIKNAAKRLMGNFTVLCANKTIPHAMKALVVDPEGLGIDGFMCPGHVSVVTGSDIYQFLARDFGIPCVVSGFEPVDMVISIEMLLKQIAEKRSCVEIQYTRSVNRSGNRLAQEIISEIFEECTAEWRGLGSIPRSGLRIREVFSAYDAARLFPDCRLPEPIKGTGCICGKILRGANTPYDCALFSKECTPANPIGACMVSSEGTCAAYYRYARSRSTGEMSRIDKGGGSG
ncbi:MAG: hydrogenase formation protein HypD [Chitinispirillia bacterium]|jgi:hydrogenase expression/formation protein HypD